MADGETPRLVSARPMLRIDGQEVPSLGDEGLVSLLTEETTLGLFRCEARLLNWGPTTSDVGYLLFGGQFVDFGKTLSVEFGPPGGNRPLFAGRISGIEAHYPAERPPEMTVLAEDRLQDLRMTRRTRSFADVKDEDVFRKVAADQGLTPQIDVSGGPTHRVLAQVNVSDLAFLRERAAALDAELWIDDKTLYVQSRARRSSGDLTLTYGKDLAEFTALADLAHQRTAVRVTGWDVGGKKAIEAEATESGAMGAEVAGLRGGGAILKGAFGERKETVVHAVPHTEEETKALAEAHYRSRARRFVTGYGTAEGNPAIRVGTRLDLRGLGAPFDGKYMVTVARHTFDARHGYRTAFEVERPGITAG